MQRNGLFIMLSAFQIVYSKIYEWQMLTHRILMSSYKNLSLAYCSPSSSQEINFNNVNIYNTSKFLVVCQIWEL